MSNVMKFATILGLASLMANPAWAQFKLPDLNEVKKKAPEIEKIVEKNKAVISQAEKIASKQIWDINPKSLACIYPGRAEKANHQIYLDGYVTINFSENPDWAGSDQKIWEPRGIEYASDRAKFTCDGTPQKLYAMHSKRLEFTGEQADKFVYRIAVDLTHTPQLPFNKTGSSTKIAHGTSMTFPLKPHAEWVYKIPARPHQPQMELRLEIKRLR